MTVTGADVDDLVLVPRRGSTVRGVVVTEAGEPPPFSASGVRMNLVAPLGAPVLPTVRLPAVEADWTFTMKNVAGPFVFRIVNLPDGWMLHAVTVGERDITDVAFDVPTGEREISDMRVVLTDQVGEVSGSVVDFQDKPTPHATIVLFSDDPSRWTLSSRFVRTTRPTAEGTFTIKGLPAGRYLAIAREFVLDGEWESREFLEAARAEGVAVLLDAGGSANVSLKLPAAR